MGLVSVRGAKDAARVQQRSAGGLRLGRWAPRPWLEGGTGRTPRPGVAGGPDAAWTPRTLKWGYHRCS